MVLRKLDELLEIRLADTSNRVHIGSRTAAIHNGLAMWTPGFLSLSLTRIWCNSLGGIHRRWRYQEQAIHRICPSSKGEAGQTCKREPFAIAPVDEKEVSLQASRFGQAAYLNVLQCQVFRLTSSVDLVLRLETQNHGE